MEFNYVINNRHSIRSFEKKKIPKPILKKIIKDATKAPSAKNLQPWKFYIISSKEKRDKLENCMKKSLKIFKKDIEKMPIKIKKKTVEFYNTMGNCQNVILIYSKKNKSNNKNNLISVSAAIENLILSAVNNKLGTCWVGSFKTFEKKINQMLKIKNEELVAGILIGYQKKDYTPLKRSKKKINEIIKFF